MSAKENRRSVMTRMLLKSALIELMQEKPFKQITIKELCERADLNRTTFYLHYTDQLSVLKDIEADVLDKTESFMNSIKPTEEVELIESFLIYVKENEKIFRSLLVHGQDSTFRNDFINCTLKQVKLQMVCDSPLEERYTTVFLMQGSIQLIIEWIESGFDLSPKEAAKLIYTLCTRINVKI